MAEDVDKNSSELILEATEDLAVAQRELERVLGDLAAKDRADKTMISVLLREVLDKVAAAKRKLGGLLGDQK